MGKGEMLSERKRAMLSERKGEMLSERKGEMLSERKRETLLRSNPSRHLSESLIQFSESPSGVGRS
jgi:hypothetical protein